MTCRRAEELKVKGQGNKDGCLTKLLSFSTALMSGSLATENKDSFKCI